MLTAIRPVNARRAGSDPFHGREPSRCAVFAVESSMNPGPLDGGDIPSVLEVECRSQTQERSDENRWPSERFAGRHFERSETSAPIARFLAQ
jgi:hypothetical protein